MTLPPEHPAWVLEAEYIAYGLNNLAVMLSPQRILVGGGVMQQETLFQLVRKKFGELLNGYVEHTELTEHLERYIQPPGLGAKAGVLGALVLAERGICS